MRECAGRGGVGGWNGVMLEGAREKALGKVSDVGQLMDLGGVVC